MERQRCPWAESSELMRRYHDEEWGRPCHNDAKLFEMLVLEGMQSGLSWSLILNKREAMREAFDGFDVSAISMYDEPRLAQLMETPGILHNRLKLASLPTNAKAFMAVQEEFETFDNYLWGFVNNTVIDNQFTSQSELPAKTELAEAISKDMKKRGFKFMGPVVVYSLMQSIGMVNDHLVSCPCHE